MKFFKKAKNTLIKKSYIYKNNNHNKQWSHSFVRDINYFYKNVKSKQQEWPNFSQNQPLISKYFILKNVIHANTHTDIFKNHLVFSSDLKTYKFANFFCIITTLLRTKLGKMKFKIHTFEIIISICKLVSN